MNSTRRHLGDVCSSAISGEPMTCSVGVVRINFRFGRCAAIVDGGAGGVGAVVVR